MAAVFPFSAIVGQEEMKRALLIAAIDPTIGATGDRVVGVLDLERALTRGENVVEREGPSISHPARFVLVGSGNPEAGELRPQLPDRFGLSVEVTTLRAQAAALTEAIRGAGGGG